MIKKHGVDQVIFAYSDVHMKCNAKASLVTAAGADFRLWARNSLRSSRASLSVGLRGSDGIRQKPDDEAGIFNSYADGYKWRRSVIRCLMEIDRRSAALCRL